MAKLRVPYFNPVARKRRYNRRRERREDRRSFRRGKKQDRRIERRLRQGQRQSVRHARIQGKREAGYWTPEAVKARQETVQTAIRGGIAVAEAGANLAGLPLDVDFDGGGGGMDYAPMDSGGMPSWLPYAGGGVALVLVVLVLVMVMGGDKKKGGK